MNWPALTAILGGLAAVDMITTQAILALGGHELNPVMAPVASSPALLFVVKAAAGVVVLVLSWRSETLLPGAGKVIAGAGIVTLLVPPIHNLVVIIG